MISDLQNISKPALNYRLFFQKMNQNNTKLNTFSTIEKNKLKRPLRK